MILVPGAQAGGAMVSINGLARCSGSTHRPRTDALVAALMIGLLGPMTVHAQGDLKPFLGSLHDHTAQDGDDGQGDAGQALTAARPAFQFFALTPHDHMVSPEAVVRLRAQTQAASRPGEFIALAGYEWGTIGKGGHVGVLGATRLFRVEATNWAGFWAAVASDPAAPLVVLNHPLWNMQFGGRPDATRDRVARLMEVMDAPGHYDGPSNQAVTDSSYLEYCDALQQGWHCGVAFGEDNHKARWGQTTPTRMGVWARALDLESVMEGCRARRTFVTQDPAMTIWTQVGTAPMGSVTATAGTYEVTVVHPNPSGLTLFTYFDADGPGPESLIEIHRGQGPRAAVKLPESSPGAYVFTVARDGAGASAVASPLWFGGAQRWNSPPNAPDEQGRAELNFDSPAALDKVPGLGGSLIKAILQARKSGTLFSSVDDLRGAVAIDDQRWSAMVANLRVADLPESTRVLRRALTHVDGPLTPDVMRGVMRGQIDRAEALIARQLMLLAKTGQRAPFLDGVAKLDGTGAALRESRRRILATLQSRASTDGVDLDPLLSPVASPR